MVEKKIKWKVEEKKTRKRRGRSVRGVDKMQRGLFPQQWKRNRRNVQNDFNDYECQI